MELFKNYENDPQFKIVLEKFLEKYQFDQEVFAYEMKNNEYHIN